MKVVENCSMWSRYEWQQQESERLLVWSEDGLPAYTPSTRRISRPATTPRNQTKATQQKAKKTTANSNQKRRR